MNPFGDSFDAATHGAGSNHRVSLTEQIVEFARRPDP
jgi:hypothetical protein